MRLRLYLRLGRVSNLPTVWTNTVAAVVLTGAAIRAETLVILVIAMSLHYVGGMFLNDAFDRKIDAVERPERPIPSGAMSATEVFAVGYGMLAAGTVLLAVAGMQSTGTPWPGAVAGLALGAAIVFYDANHKANPLSPFVMGLCRVLVYVGAAVAVTGRIAAPVAAGSLVLLSYLIGLTYVAKQENLREYRNVWPLAFLFAPFVYAAGALGTGLTGVLIYVGFLAWVLYAISFLVLRRRLAIPRAVISFIAGISLLDALLVARQGGVATAWLVSAGFLLTLFLQRYVRGT